MSSFAIRPCFSPGLALHVLAQFGQKLGAQQAFRLHRIYEAAIGGKLDVR